MNELLQKHGCSNVFTVPEGLKELMADITREVLRDQPSKIFDYIANYLSVLLITREHGILAVKILDDLCDCRPSVSEHLLQHGMEKSQAETLSQIIKEEVEGVEPFEGKETVKETLILKKILTRTALDEEMAAKVCHFARNAYRDYWYRKKLMEKNLKVHPNEAWEIAAERTLELYKKTKPSFSELNRATEKIQAAYRGYHVRRNTLHHLKPMTKKKEAKVDLPGPPIDVAGSREIDLGPVLDIKVREVDTTLMFQEAVRENLGLSYDPMKTIKMKDSPAIEEPKLTKFEEPKSMKIEEPRSMKFEEPRSMKFEEPRSMKFEEPSSMTFKEPSSMTMEQPRNMKIEEPKTTKFGEPSLTKFLEPIRTKSDEQIQETFKEPIPTKSGSRTGGLSARSVSSRLGVESLTLNRKGQMSQNVAEEAVPEQRQFRISSMRPDSRESGPIRVGSKHSPVAESSLHKTSYAERQLQSQKSLDIPEEIIIEEPEKFKHAELSASELKLTKEHAHLKTVKHDSQEVPEDIPDDVTEGDESAPTASIPSSGPGTAYSSDVEDAGDTAEDDGE